MRELVKVSWLAVNRAVDEIAREDRWLSKVVRGGERRVIQAT